MAPALQPLAVQPWEDEPAPLSQSPALPPGQLLSVREPTRPASNVDTNESVLDEPDRYMRNQATALVKYEQGATKLVAVPVRQQSESRVDAPDQQVTPVLIPTEEGDFWQTTVQQLIQAEAINAMVRELALQSQLVARDTDQWLLRVERESLNQLGTRDRLTTALQHAGFAVKLVVEIGRVTDCPARRNMAASAEKQLAAEKIIFDDPYVQAMMRDFGAKIVPGSIKPIS